MTYEEEHEKRKKEMPGKLKSIMDNGGFVKWVANRTYKSWNCFAQIVEFDKEDNTLKVKTYDDGKTSEISLFGDSFDNEVKGVSKDEIATFLEKEISKSKFTLETLDLDLQKEIKTLEFKSREKKESLEKNIEETKNLLQTF